MNCFDLIGSTAGTVVCELFLSYLFKVTLGIGADDITRCRLLQNENILQFVALRQKNASITMGTDKIAITMMAIVLGRFSVCFSAISVFTSLTVVVGEGRISVSVVVKDTG
jgi:hypothetical protein